jgi:thiol:disulfide interchange protein DsbD
MAAWIRARASTARLGSWFAAALGLLWTAGLLMAWPLMTGPNPTKPPLVEAPGAAPSAAWLPWQPNAPESAARAGRTVLVDFTAAWCITCQFNKATALADPKLLALAASGQVVLLRADWTRRDPDITQALTALGRSGVPTYAVYRPGAPVRLLSEMPSVQEVLQAVAPGTPGG